MQYNDYNEACTKKRLILPAKDNYHDAVANALIKEGWTISPKQKLLLVGKRHLWIDIEAIKASENLAILVEVKGFEYSPSPIEYLAEVIGKYTLYSGILEYINSHLPLYLAVPIQAYTGILSEPVGKISINKANIKLIVFEPSTEEILLWIPVL